MSDGLFRVETTELRSKAQVHAEIAERLSSMIAPPSSTTGVATSHGSIASNVSDALDEALAARAEALRATSRESEQLADLLLRAAQAYDAADEQSARRL